MKGRYHRARQIAALWNEDDPLTRARLLAAFAVSHFEAFGGERPGALRHLQVEFAKLLPALAPAEKTSLTEFLQWCEADALAKLPDEPDPVIIQSVIETLRGTLNK